MALVQSVDFDWLFSSPLADCHGDTDSQACEVAVARTREDVRMPAVSF